MAKRGVPATQDTKSPTLPPGSRTENASGTLPRIVSSRASVTYVKGRVFPPADSSRASCETTVARTITGARRASSRSGPA